MAILSFVVSEWLERTLARRNIDRAFDDPQAR